MCVLTSTQGILIAGDIWEVLRQTQDPQWPGDMVWPHSVTVEKVRLEAGLRNPPKRPQASDRTGIRTWVSTTFTLVTERGGYELLSSS